MSFFRSEGQLIVVLVLAIFLFPTLVLAQSADLDSDNDGLTDHEEREIYFTNPMMADTDYDGYDDALEITNGFSPLWPDRKLLKHADTDNDGASDAWEIAYGTSLIDADTDDDGFADGLEIMAGYDPLSSSSEKLSKHIAVDLSDQLLVYYFNDIALDSFHISSGLRYTPTPVGEYSVLNKIENKRYVGAGYDFPNTKWNLHFTTGRLGYYIHGAYWHDNFGQPMSHGCVNVAYSDMEPLYHFAQLDTSISIVN